MLEHPLKRDLDSILEANENSFLELRGERIFISGATGFIGKWLLETLLWSNQKLALNLSITALSRNPDIFLRSHPRFGVDACLRLLRGDIRSFEFPKGTFSHVVHAATDVGSVAAAADHRNIFDVSVRGTQRLLEFCRERSVARLLFTSSGAVYGVQPPSLEHTPETYLGAPDPTQLNSAYGEGKRVAEWLICAEAAATGMESKIARCYAFLGPYMELDGPFAIGNFIGAALAGRNLDILGDGRPFRSYLYASDLVEWLVTIFFQGKANTPYNVGSEEPHTILEVAEAVVKAVNPLLKCEIKGVNKNGPPGRYVPSARKAREELGLMQKVPLPVGIERTVNWHRTRIHQP
ncbi:MAG: NAD-dependent epimerase/dehydratase family protein [Kiritimatiellae bacterium]|nr:NAD-dependent epimerase/dehydratase family protein [Kiritimatiellia bacterium]